VLLFVGYQAKGTLGELILHGASSARIHGQSYPVRIRVEEINSFSAHAGKSDLQRWISNLKSPPKHIFLTHGEEAPITSLESYIQSKGWAVSSPTYLEKFEL
jgi:metallo-beta-lactamase family protein